MMIKATRIADIVYCSRLNARAPSRSKPHRFWLLTRRRNFVIGPSEKLNKCRAKLSPLAKRGCKAELRCGDRSSNGTCVDCSRVINATRIAYISIIDVSECDAQLCSSKLCVGPVREIELGGTTHEFAQVI